MAHSVGVASRDWQSDADQQTTAVPLTAGRRYYFEVLHKADVGDDHLAVAWQLPGGPRTEAVFLKPAGAKGPLPGILALHDHGGNKFLGWRKIARVDDQPWEIVASHQEHYYGGVAWANEIAKRVMREPRRFLELRLKRGGGSGFLEHARRGPLSTGDV